MNNQQGATQDNSIVAQSATKGTDKIKNFDLDAAKEKIKKALN